MTRKDLDAIKRWRAGFAGQDNLHAVDGEYRPLTAVRFSRLAPVYLDRLIAEVERLWAAGAPADPAGRDG